MRWDETLTDIFGAYVNQQTLEEGVHQMVFVSSDNLEYHHKFMEAINQGIESLQTDCQKVTEIINKSGYHVDNGEEASILLHELRRSYLDRYEQTAT